jgi:hypothetical protein
VSDDMATSTRFSKLTSPSTALSITFFGNKLSDVKLPSRAHLYT